MIRDLFFIFTSYRRQLSDFINALGANSLFTKRMEELFPITPLPDDSDWDENELKVRSRFPSVLVIEAIKL